MVSTRVVAPDLDLSKGTGSEWTLFTTVRDRYFDLVELVCDAANAGVNAEMAAHYVIHAGWFRRNWPTVGDWLLRWVPAEVAASGDPFTVLFAPLSLTELLALDGGRLIEALGHGQLAFEAWEADLRGREEKA